MRIRRLLRFSFPAVLAGSLLLVIGSAGAAPGSAKRIAYVSGGNIFTIGANGIGTSDQGVAGSNPSISTDGATILYDAGGSIRQVGSGAAICTGTDPAIAPNGLEFVYDAGGSLAVATLAGPACTTVSYGFDGTDPAWSPDGTAIVFVDTAGDVAIAERASGAGAQKLGTTAAVESDPSWSPDGTRIAFVANGEIFVMNADGSGRTQVTSNAVTEESPSWSPSGDELVYAAGGGLHAVTVANGISRQLQDATSASSPNWGLAVANIGAPTIVRQDGSSAHAVDVFDGDQLSAGTGSWTGISGITGFSYQWKRCGAATCVDIPGATGGTYTVVGEDIGSTIRVTVTAATPDGTAPGTSAKTTVVKRTAPVNVSPPTISGTTIIGGTVTADPGTWTGSNLVFTYQWQRCALDGTGCADIAGAVFTTFSPTSTEVGKTLKVVVKASNASGTSAPASSIASPPVSSNIPANSVLPAIVETVGTTGLVTSYSATQGTWTGAGTITYRYQWQRCDSAGANCRDIPGATSSVYTPATADIGGRLRVVVTATNTFGSTNATSEPSALLAGQAPTNMIRPSISGNETTGSSLFVSNGTWTGSAPITFTYQWQRCNASGTGCANIASATASSYIPTAADIGSRISVVVTARNASGTATAAASPTDPITQGTTNPATTTRPANTAAPTIKGTLARGKVLTALPGTWSGTTPMTFSYQWQRCPRTTTACTPIAGATRSTYTLAAADVSRRIRLTVSAANGAGSTAATSAISKVVAAKAPAAIRRINGNARANRLTGTARAERIDGKGGNDRIDGKGGKDVLIGGTGNDTILAADGIAETVNCGPGRDRVTADRSDRLIGCERVTRRPARRR
jgi:uncharacterized protein YukE